MIHWIRRNTAMHTHFRTAGLRHWFVSLDAGKHAQLCATIRKQKHARPLTEDDIHAIAAVHQTHHRKWWLIFGLLLMAPFAHAQGTVNVIPVKQFQDAVNHAFNVSCVSGCAGGASFLDNSAFTVSTTSISNIGAYFTSGADPACTTGNSCRLRIDASSNLRVNCIVGCAGGSTTPADTFANPSTAGLQFDLLAGYNGTTWDRLRSTIANGLQVDVTRVQGNVAMTGTFFQGTQPVSGTVTTSPPANASTNVAQVAGVTLGATAVTNYGTAPAAAAVPGVNAFITNTPAVTLASTTVTGTVAVTESGTWSNRVVGNAGGIFDTTQNAAVPANALSMGCNFTTAPATITTGNQGAAQCNSKGELLTQLTDGTTNVAVIAGTTALKTDLSSVAGTATSTAAAGVQLVGIEGRAGTSMETTAGVLDANVKNIGNSAVSTAAAGIQKVGITGNTGAALDAAGTNVAAPANELLVGCQFVTAPTTLTTTNIGPLQCNNKGEPLTQLTDGTTNVAVIAGTTALKTDMSSIAGTATGTATAGVQKVGIVGGAGVLLDGGVGTVVPTNAIMAAGRDSTQTNGGIAVPVICDKSAFINPTTATTTQIVALSGSTVIYVCGYVISNGTVAQSVILKFGTGAACGTGTTSLTATYFLPINGTFSYGTGIGTVARTTAGQALCATTSGSSVSTGVTVSYAQF